MLLGKEQLLQRPSLPTEDVELPSFGGSVRVRAWTGADYDAFGTAVQFLMFDMNGDIQRLAASIPKQDLETVWLAIRRINNLGNEGIEAAEKN
jgi:hypothetical protein